MGGMRPPGNENVTVLGETTIATQVSPTTVDVGQTFTDTATVTGSSGGPAPTGTVTFTVFFDPPGAAPCSGTSQTLPPAPLAPGPPGNPPTATATSASVTAAGPGTYRFVASYSGDANYAALPTTPCGEPNENVTVRSAPTLTTQATNAVLGSPISDAATLAGGASPTGTITFSLFGPDNATCAGAPIFVSTVPVSGNGTYNSGPFTPATLGAYRWVVTYSGDASNAATTSPCNAPNETSMVTTICASPPPPGTLPGNTIIAQPGVITVGTDGDDVIYGTPGNDRIFGMGGNDIIFGMGGDDQISGGAGDDIICGGDGNDQLSGGDGDDFLSGDAGDDDLSGGAGNDVLLGGPGVDRLSGGAGFDECHGGGQPGDMSAVPGCEVVT